MQCESDVNVESRLSSNSVQLLGYHFFLLAVKKTSISFQRNDKDVCPSKLIHAIKCNFKLGELKCEALRNKAV